MKTPYTGDYIVIEWGAYSLAARHITHLMSEADETQKTSL